jgi:DNA-binding response OmpR family regulator
MNAALDADVSCRPCLILAHADPAYRAAASRAFRRRGWDVYAAQTGPEARRLARMMEPQLVVLDVDLPEESGWLLCEKLIAEQPACKVLLVAAEPTYSQRTFASFVGASALLDRSASLCALDSLVAEPALPVG